MLGVPSNKEARLSGATIKTLAMLQTHNAKKRQGQNSDKTSGEKKTKEKHTYIPSSSNFSSMEGALKLRTNSPYSVMSRFNRSPPLQKQTLLCTISSDKKDNLLDTNLG